MNCRRSLLLALWCLWVFSARGQTAQNDLIAPSAKASADRLTEDEHWAKVSELPTTLNVRATRTKAEDTYPEFADSSPGDVITFGAGDTKTFENVEIIGRSVVVERGAQITFLNVKFKETSASHKTDGASGVFGLLTAWDEETKVTLRNCDFEGQNNGSGKYPSLVHGKAQTLEGSIKGPAAEFDAEGCYTWGYTSDGWKIARGDVRYCVWDLPINVDCDPVRWNSGKADGYAVGEIVLDPTKTLYESKAWVNTVAGNTQEPTFNKTTNEDVGVVARGWRYINPHSDYLHWFASAYPKRAFGCLANADDSTLPLKSTPGSGRVGTNNAWRLDNGDENNPERLGAEIVGCVYYRNNARAARAVQHATYPSASMTQEQKDDFMFKVRHCRTNADARKAIDNRDWIVVENLRTLDGSQKIRIAGNVGERTTDYFMRNDPTALPFSRTEDPESSSEDVSDFDVFVLSEIGQSEIVHARGDRPVFRNKGPVPALNAPNVTVIVGDNLTDGVANRVVTPTVANAANEVNRGVIAAANAFGKRFPDKHLVLAPQAISGTSLGERLNNGSMRAENKAVRDALAAHLAAAWSGKRIKKVALWQWWNAERTNLQEFIELNCEKVTGLDKNGNKSTRFPLTLWDLSGEGRDAIFDKSWTLVMGTPGPEQGANYSQGKPPVPNFPKKNPGYSISNGKVNSMEFIFSLERHQRVPADRNPIVAEYQAFLNLPFMAPIAGKVVGGPIIATFADPESDGEGSIHPSHYSRYGQTLMGSHMLAQALAGSGYGGPPRIMGHTTSADGLKTTVRVGLPNGGTLSTFAREKNTKDDSRFTRTGSRDYIQEGGTGFAMRPRGQTWADAVPLRVKGSSDGPNYGKGTVTIIEPGTGSGSARYGEVEINWATAHADGDQLSYHPWGGFNWELDDTDWLRLPNQHFLIEHIPGMDDRTPMGFPGLAVMFQTGSQNDAVGEMILRPGGGYIGAPDNGRDMSGGSIADGDTSGGGSSSDAPTITARRPALDGSLSATTAITVDWDRPVKLADQGVIKIRRTDTGEELIRYDNPARHAPEVRLSGHRLRLFIDPSLDLPKGVLIEVLASRTAITAADGTPIAEADKLLARYTVSGGGSNAANARTVSPGGTDIALYPNPSEGTFTLVLPPDSDLSQVSVLDLSGKVVYQTTTQGKRRLPLTTTLLTGSYLVKVVGAKASYVKRLIVE